ncbi:MAG TPA: NAD-dependent epimerase/dehydratase family protein [Gemmatimonadaceae bacterium]|nr:NAD-dependent epimerase/dehydratase family protein [Gemmatimonadaceae bacterium]
MTGYAARDPGTVVITGANGFIGRHLSRSLAARGIRVRGITRSQQGVPVGGVETVLAKDLHDRGAIRSALTGATTVVHLAARVHAKNEGTDGASECRRINVEGTRLVLEEAANAGATGFLFVSSVKAVAGESDRVLTEDTPPQPVDPYGESKLEAERLVRVIAAREGIHAPILRLPNVYGPGMKANMVLLFKAVEKGVPMPFASLKNRRSFAYIDNAVAAIEGLMTSPAASDATVYVSDEEDVSTESLVRHIARAMQKPARLFSVPSAILKGATATGDLLSRFARFHLMGDSLAAVLGSLFVDTTSLRETTGYTPITSVETGMARTAEWYKSRSQAISS